MGIFKHFIVGMFAAFKPPAPFVENILDELALQPDSFRGSLSWDGQGVLIRAIHGDLADQGVVLTYILNGRKLAMKTRFSDGDVDLTWIERAVLLDEVHTWLDEAAPHLFEPTPSNQDEEVAACPL